MDFGGNTVPAVCKETALDRSSVKVSEHLNPTAPAVGPPSLTVRELQALFRRRDDQRAMSADENQLQSGHPRVSTLPQPIAVSRVSITRLVRHPRQPKTPEVDRRT